MSLSLAPANDSSAMAESVGLAATIIQIAGAGIALSTTLYNLVRSASRPDSDIADIADDVKLTANTLDSVGKVFENDDGHSLWSRKAMQEASSLIVRCDAIFGDIQQIIVKRREMGKDGERSLSTLMQKQRVELVKRRLESLKDSLMLMLHILHLANRQARGEIEKRALDQERERIRVLHQLQQESCAALQSLESRLSNVPLSDDDTLHSSNAPSRIPTIDFLVNAPARSQSMSAMENHSGRAKLESTSGHLSDDSCTSDSDDTMAENGDERMTSEELAQCATHVQTLLKCITTLQRSFEAPVDQKNNGPCPKQRVHKLYRRFCRKFESEIDTHRTNTVTSAAPFPGFQPSHIVRGGLEAQRTASRASHPRQGSTIHEDGRRSNPSNPTEEYHRTDHTANIARPADSIPWAISHPEVTSHRDPYFSNVQRQPARQYSANVSIVPRMSVHSEDASREGSKEGSQSGADRDGEQTSQGSVPVQYTKTGRVSKAKKGLKVHTCSECGKSFTRAEHLRRHQKNHGPDQVSCELCGKVFFRVDLLMRHVERHKEGPMVNTPTSGHPASPYSPGEKVSTHLPSKPNEGGYRTNRSEAGKSSQSGYYVWNETERRYEEHYAIPPPTGQVASVPRLAPISTRQTYHGPSQLLQHGARPDFQEFDSSPRNMKHAVSMSNTGERRCTEGTIYQSPPSPTRSPPSPWIKESRTLPPLRPSPSQASFGKNIRNTKSEGRVRPTSPALGGTSPILTQAAAATTTAAAAEPAGSYSRLDEAKLVREPHALPHISTSQTTHGRVAPRSPANARDTSRPHIRPRADAYADTPRSATAETSSHYDHSENWRAVNLSSSDFAWAKHQPSSKPRRYSLVDPAPSTSKSRPTSPTSSSVPRTYPNPIRPHHPTRDTASGQPHSPQGLPSPVRTFAAKQQDAMVHLPPSMPREFEQARQKDRGRDTLDRESVSVSSGKCLEEVSTLSYGSDVSGAQASSKRKSDEEICHTEQAGDDQNVKLYGRDRKRQKFEQGASSAHAIGGIDTNRNDAPHGTAGEKDIVDVLLEEWTVPVY